MKWIFMVAFIAIAGVACVAEDRAPNYAKTTPALAATQNDDTTLSRGINPNVIDNDCPIGLVSGIPMDDEFGPGTTAITRCLALRQNIHVVYSVNRTCGDADCIKPYAIGNIKNAINDYEITHGLAPYVNYRIAMVLYHAGATLALNNNAPERHVESNPFQDEIQALIASGVSVYLCQNAARSRKIKTAQLIPGVRFVTAGVTAIADLQALGYSLIVP